MRHGGGTFTVLNSFLKSFTFTVLNSFQSARNFYRQADTLFHNFARAARAAGPEKFGSRGPHCLRTVCDPCVTLTAPCPDHDTQTSACCTLNAKCACITRSASAPAPDGDACIFFFFYQEHRHKHTWVASPASIAQKRHPPVGRGMRAAFSLNHTGCDFTFYFPRKPEPGRSQRAIATEGGRPGLNSSRLRAG